MERKGPRILRHCAAERLGVVGIMRMTEVRTLVAAGPSCNDVVNW